MPFRWEPSPEERLEYIQRCYDLYREVEVGLDGGRHAPARVLLCEVCGRTVDAQLLCPACGDEDQVAA